MTFFRISRIVYSMDGKKVRRAELSRWRHAMRDSEDSGNVIKTTTLLRQPTVILG